MGRGVKFGGPEVCVAAVLGQRGGEERKGKERKGGGRA